MSGISAATIAAANSSFQRVTYRSSNPASATGITFIFSDRVAINGHKNDSHWNRKINSAALINHRIVVAAEAVNAEARTPAAASRIRNGKKRDERIFMGN